MIREAANWYVNSRNSNNSIMKWVINSTKRKEESIVVIGHVQRN